MTNAQDARSRVMHATIAPYFDDPDDELALNDVNLAALATIEHALYVIVNNAPIPFRHLIDAIATIASNVDDFDDDDVDLPDFCRTCTIDYDAMTPDERALHICEGEHVIMTCDRRYNAVIVHA